MKTDTKTKSKAQRRTRLAPVSGYLKATAGELRRALRNAAEEVFKLEELDTDMWELRDEGMTKADWLDDKIEEWLSDNTEVSGARPPLANHNENVRTGERSLH